MSYVIEHLCYDCTVAYLLAASPVRVDATQLCPWILIHLKVAKPFFGFC